MVTKSYQPKEASKVMKGGTILDERAKQAVMFLRARWIEEAGRDRAREDRLISDQRQACEAAAERLGATLIREYAEYGGTGAIEQRPVLRQMLDELLALRDVDYVLVTSLDRLARSYRDMRAIWLEVEAAGAKLVIANGAYPFEVAEWMWA